MPLFMGSKHFFRIQYPDQTVIGLINAFKILTLDTADTCRRRLYLAPLRPDHIADPFHQEPDLLVFGIDDDVPVLVRVDPDFRQPEFPAQIDDGDNLTPQVQDPFDIFRRLGHRCHV